MLALRLKKDLYFIGWLFFKSRDKERAEFVANVIEKHGIHYNLDILSPKGIFYNRRWDHTLVTPLQLAIESYSCRVAVVLIKNFASIDNLSLPSGTAFTSDIDVAALHVMLRMLEFLDFTCTQLDKLKLWINSRYKTFKQLEESKSFPSLLKLAYRSFRRNTTRQEILSLIEGLDLGVKVKDNLFMNHIQELQFPENPSTSSGENVQSRSRGKFLKYRQVHYLDSFYDADYSSNYYDDDEDDGSGLFGEYPSNYFDEYYRSNYYEEDDSSDFDDPYFM